MKITDVERPKYAPAGGRQKDPASLRQRLFRTAETGQAIRVDLEGRDYRAVQALMGSAMYRSPYSVRTQRPDDGSPCIIAWAEKKESPRG